MKLYFISAILLLVPLGKSSSIATCNLQVLHFFKFITNPLSTPVFELPVSAKPMAKILYTNNGTNDYLIIDADNLVVVGYSYLRENELDFKIQKNRIPWSNPYLTLKSDLLKKEKTSFVVDWQTEEGGKSSESLKHLINRISRKVILREPNEEERRQLEEFKEKQKRMHFFERKLKF